MPENTNKYQIIVEAVVKNTTEQQNALKNSLSEITKNVNLTIENIVLSENAVKGLQAQLKKALTVKQAVNVEVDPSKTKKISNDIEKNIKDGLCSLSI